jgi:regulator of extracellular matrix RemA (YlzA/DUF370 family)
VYQLPLRFIKVSDDVSICATRIVAIMSTNAYQARRTIKDEKQAGTLINAAGRAKVNSAIFLDNGSVIASPLTVTRLLSAIEKSNYKQVNPRKFVAPARMRVYDVDDEEPDPELDEEVAEVDVETDEDEPDEQADE